MRQFLLFVFLFFSITLFSQHTDSLKSITDSSINTLSDQIKRYDDSVNNEMIKRQTQQSVDYFVRMQKERNAKAKKEAIMRIAIGIGFFIILIIGLVRRRRKAKK